MLGLGSRSGIAPQTILSAHLGSGQLRRAVITAVIATFSNNANQNCGLWDPFGLHLGISWPSRGWNSSELINPFVEWDRFGHSRGWNGTGLDMPGDSMGQVWSFQGG